MEKNTDMANVATPFTPASHCDRLPTPFFRSLTRCLKIPICDSQTPLWTRVPVNLNRCTSSASVALLWKGRQCRRRLCNYNTLEHRSRKSIPWNPWLPLIRQPLSFSSSALHSRISPYLHRWVDWRKSWSLVVRRPGLRLHDVKFQCKLINLPSPSVKRGVQNLKDDWVNRLRKVEVKSSLF